MAKIPQFDLNGHNVKWDVNLNRFVQYHSWGYIHPGGMAVLDRPFNGNPEFAMKVAKELGVRVLRVGYSSLPKVWDDQGRRVIWSSIRERWWLWDTDHDIVLPQPALHRPIVYLAPTARPYISGIAEDWYRKITHSIPNKEKIDEFRKMVRAIKAKMAFIGGDKLKLPCSSPLWIRLHAHPLVLAIKNGTPLPNIEEITVEDLALLCHSNYNPYSLEKLDRLAMKKMRIPFSTSYLTTRKP